MSHGLLEILKYFFLALLWLFFLYAARAVLADGKRARGERREPDRLTRQFERRSPIRLRITAGEYRGETIELSHELTFGRSPACDISLDRDTYASSVHARLFMQGNDAIVEDLGSTNGTFVNEERIDGPTSIDRGDKVQIGSTVLEVRR